MGDLLIPPWLRISATEPAIASNSVGSESTFTNALRSTERAGDKVKVGISTANASDRETDPNIGLLMAIRAALRGFGGRVWYTPAGYNIRGSFPASELLPNNTFANATTGWTQGSQYSLSVADRVMRCRRTAVTISGIPLAASSAAAVTQYAPYVLRAMLMQGRGNFAAGFDLALGSTAGASDYADSTNSAAYGMHTLTAVAPAATMFSSIRDLTSSGLIAGDYLSVPYISLARCALVDNGLNLLLHSDDFTNTGVWGALTATGLSGVTANALAALDGTVTADSLIENGASSTHRRSQDAVVPSAAADFTVSVEVKAGTRTWAYLFLEHATGSASAWINLANGALGNVGPGTDWTNPRAFVEPKGDGWYVLHLVARKTSAATTVRGAVGLATGNSVQSYAGDGTSNIYVRRMTLVPSGVPTRGAQTTTTASTGTSQTGGALHIKGLPPSTNGLLRYGAWIQTGKQLGMVVARLDSDAAGLGYLQLAYPPRVQPPDGDPLIVFEPMGRFYSMDVEAAWSERPGILADHSWTICEALDS